MAMHLATGDATGVEVAEAGASDAAVAPLKAPGK